MVAHIGQLAEEVGGKVLSVVKTLSITLYLIK